MTEEKTVTNEIIANKRYLIRGQKVMLDTDLAALYNLTNKSLMEQVKKNIKHFPAHFMFRLTETDLMVSKNEILSKKDFEGSLPFAFTGDGILQLAQVLKGDCVMKMSIKILVFNYLDGVFEKKESQKREKKLQAFL